MLRAGAAVAAAAAIAAVLAGGCSSSEPAGADGPVAPPATEATSNVASDGSTSAEPSGPSGPSGPSEPRFASRARALSHAERQAMTGVTWRPGCPVALDDLRLLRLSYYDFDGDRRTGRLVVHADVAADVRAIFRTLYGIGFPIRRMEPIEAYGGDDYASIEADNTSAFNCRPATGSNEWSHHAFGVAIDLNPLENPYVYDGGRTSHQASVPYLDRTRAQRGVLLADGAAVAAFEDAGWYWGGRWSDPIDYQHFSARPQD